MQLAQASLTQNTLIPTLVQTINYFSSFLFAMIFIRVILSWFSVDRNNPLISLLYTLTEPILAPIRKLLFKSPIGGPGMMIDFSPIIAFMLIEFLKNIIINIIIGFA